MNLTAIDISKPCCNHNITVTCALCKEKLEAKVNFIQLMVFSDHYIYFTSLDFMHVPERLTAYDKKYE